MNTIITADIGGTQIRVAVFPENEIKPLRQKKISTKGNEPAHTRMINLMAELWLPGETVLAISVAAPGPLDPKAGVILNAPNVAGWVNLPLAQLIRERFQIPVFLGNDANLAALGEWRFGAGQGHHNLLYFTISTGIGGGVIDDDRLILGEHGLATELGHVTIDPDGPVCTCGLRGHLEAYSSGTGISRYVAQHLAAGCPSSLLPNLTPSAREISQAAQAGDALAMEAIQRAGRYMGIAIANYLHIFNPSIVILGGGVTNSGELLFGPLRKALNEFVLSSGYTENLVLTTAALGDDVGLLGALALAKENLAQPLFTHV